MIRYYAVPDPDDPDQMTYWRQVGRLLKPWPAYARYGPTLRPVDVPPELLGADRAAWIHQWYKESAQEWSTAVLLQIQRDPDTCQARFAVHTGRCGLCAARLTDQRGRLYGVGPECVRAMPAVWLVALELHMLTALSEEAQRCAAR